MSNLIDMGVAHGHHLFYTSGRSLAELIADGEIVAIPDAAEGIIYKRTVNATPLELAAKLTVDEAKKVTKEWNSRL